MADSHSHKHKRKHYENDDKRSKKKKKKSSDEKHHRRDKRDKIKNSKNSEETDSRKRDIDEESDLNEDRILKNAPPKKEETNSESDDMAYGPALPPHLMKKNEKSTDQKKNDYSSQDVVTGKKFVGPEIPKHFKHLVDGETQNFTASPENFENPSDSEAEDEDDIVGPTLPDINKMSTAQLELEKRALEIKLAGFDGSGPSTSGDNAKVREEWMLELPEVGTLKTLGPVARKFQTKDRPDFSDRSSWTDIAGHKKDKTKDRRETDKKKKVEDLASREADLEQERLAAKHKEKHKRDKSLVEMHQQKLKEKKKEDKNSDKPERRPFSREVDLQVNRFDKNQTNSVIKKAQLLDSRFSKGAKKYL